MSRVSLTKSSAEPPPRYSMMIHNLLPWKTKCSDNSHWGARAIEKRPQSVPTESAPRSHFEVGAVILGDVGTVALAQHGDLLLDVLDFVLGLLQVDDLDGHHAERAVVDAFEHLPVSHI